MNKSEILKATEAFVKSELTGAEAGHDWWHIQRVRNTAIVIGKKEGADIFIVELASLLHDIADSKFHDGNEDLGPAKAGEHLSTLGVDEKTTQHILDIIRYISFRKSMESFTFSSLELRVVQDADRLDAIGAIGIARAFNYGGHKNRTFYDPEIPPSLEMTSEQYKKSTSPTINHFYEKLLLLKDMMNTETGKKMAEQRHEFMEEFLSQFYDEWSGNS